MSIKDKRIGVICALEATLGGTRKYCVDYLSRLDLNQFDVTFIYSMSRADAQFEKDLKTLQKLGIKLKEIQMVREIRPISDLKSFIRLIIYLKSINYAVIHLHSSKAGFLGRLASRIAHPKAATIYHPHMLAHRLGKIYIILEKFAGIFTDTIIAESESEAKIIKEINLVSLEKMVTIYPGIDVSVLTDEDSSSSLSSRESIIVGAVSRLTYPKDPFTFIRAAKIILDQSINAKFYWVGEGDLFDASQELIKQLGIQDYVFMLGWQDNVAEWINKFDVFVHSSNYEAFGLVIAEAMAWGKPVVASDVTGVRDIVDVGITGYLYPPQNAEILASYIMLYAKDRKKAEEFGNAGKKRIIDKFTIESTVKKISDLYKELVSGVNN